MKSGDLMAQVEWKMKGEYMKNCNCIATCPCDTVGATRWEYVEHTQNGITGF
jgi:hypothetical protein